MAEARAHRVRPRRHALSRRRLVLRAAFAAVARPVWRTTAVCRRSSVLPDLADAVADGRARPRDFRRSVRRPRLPTRRMVAGARRACCREHRPRRFACRDSLAARARAGCGRRGGVGVLTNGLPGSAARKVAALGLAALVDAVVFAHEMRQRRGKPDAARFRAVCARLRVSPGASVFVGDDVAADMRRGAPCRHADHSCASRRGTALVESGETGSGRSCAVTHHCRVPAAARPRN